jgi:hypothetical protein
MQINRKSTALITDSSGVEHPDACICVTGIITNPQFKELTITFGLFHNKDAYTSGKAPLSYYVQPFYFNTVNIAPDVTNIMAVIDALENDTPNKYEVLNTIHLGRGAYEDVLEMLDLENAAEPQTLMAKLWIMEQLDFEGVPFRENWELANGDKFEYETQMLAFLNALINP